MKIPIFFLIFVLSFGILFSSNFQITNAESPGKDPSLPEIKLQLVYRNSDGILIHYMEPTIFYLNNIYLLHEFLDIQKNKSIFTKDGQEYEKIIFERKYDLQPGRQVSQYVVYHTGVGVLTAAHIGFITTESGTSYTVTWTIVRNVQ